ncbi:tachylectin-related carbohydrate-binding protein [Actinokineospora alba]|uniref:tachylectin-related carbohydrate-binding protein n=1 Tax=Actinokineospora alba TaxID=504798 RepID=UPI001414F3EF|nr:tachylectin-related carbohydrate-binding protein [Actinokineospora alba]
MALIGALAVVGLPLVAGNANVASAAVSLQCTPSVTIFGASTDNTMWINEHNEPETGANSMTGRGNQGGGWSGRVLAGRDGHVFWLPGNGELRRWQWNGSTFHSYELLQEKRWYGWDEPANVNRITVDANNNIYNVLSNGTLEVNIYNETSKNWTVRTLATDWGKYDLIFGSGNGVIYARDPAIGGGTLFRYQYDVANQRWLGYNRQLSGGGWNIHRQVFSPGADIIYGITSDTGQLTAYRYDPHTHTWPNGYTALGTGWATIRNASATTNNCGSTTPADTIVQCKPSVTIFGASTDDKMWINEHNEPETGINDMWGRGNFGGGGWSGRVLAGRDGHVFWLPGNGELRRWQWNGTDFHSYEVLATNRWYGWSDAANVNRITVDSNNNIYNVLSNGTLEVNQYNETSKSWTVRTLANDWGKYDLIVAAGNGVLYARDPAIGGGTLFRYQYDVVSQRWVTFNRQLAGGGWNVHRQVFSPGADIIYGITSDTGQLAEYRYDPQANVWTIGYAALSTGWSGIRNASATTNTCSPLNPTTVTRPTVPASAIIRPQGLLNPANNILEFAFVDELGVLKRGVQRNQGTELIDFQGMAGGDAGGVTFTGRASATFRADGKLVLAANRTNADAFTYTQSGGFNWNAPADIRGSMVSSPQLVKGAGGLLTAFSIDAAGKLWYATQVSTTGDLLPWRQADGVAGSAISVDFTVIPTGDSAEIVYRTTGNVVEVRKFQNGTLQAARATTGLVAAGVPSGVAFADGNVQVVTRGADNNLYTQKESANGFTGWQLVGGLTVKGSPSVILNPHGIVEIAARGDDDYVYRTGQIAPGSNVWRIWETNLDSGAQTDPSLVSVSGTECRIFFLNQSGSYFLVQQTPYTSDPGAAMSASTARTSKQARKVDAKVSTGSVK